MLSLNWLNADTEAFSLEYSFFGLCAVTEVSFFHEKQKNAWKHIFCKQLYRWF